MMQLTTNSSLRGQLAAMALGGTGAGSVTVRIDSVSADTIKLTAIGSYGSSPLQTVTVAATRQGINLGITGAMGVSRNSTAQVKITGAGSLIDGKDYLAQDPPTINSSGTAIDGISSSLASDLSLSGTNNGIPILGKRAVPAKDTVALGTGQPDWNSLPGQLIPKANRVVTSAPGSNQTWGTWRVLRSPTSPAAGDAANRQPDAEF